MDRDAELFQSLADATRLRLLNLLIQAGKICVCELVDALQVPQYNISRHLHALLTAGWLEDHRRGKWVYYGLRKDLQPCQRTLLRAVEQLREAREDFIQDEKRACHRLNLRRGGLCCVGLVAAIGAALSRKSPRQENGADPRRSAPARQEERRGYVKRDAAS